MARTNTTLFTALLDARARHGGKFPVLEDAEFQPLTYNRLILGALVLGGKLAEFTEPGEYVGVLLPNVNGVVATFFALAAFNRRPAMLNFSAGLLNIRAAITTAGIKTVLTSRRFIEKAGLQDLIDGLEGDVSIVWLDDIKTRITAKDKITGLARMANARRFHRRFNIQPGDPAIVLFTSGSEGVPKGVVLSQANILANVRQIFAATEFHPGKDCVFNSLPVFHCFGLTAGMLLPVLNGMRCFLYPSPLHYRLIPPLIRKVKATILFGTDTFLTGYARSCQGNEMASLRLVIAGAERLRRRTRALWQDKLGIEIYEGYGATEASPVIAVNTPGRARHGTVGPLLSEMEYKLDPVPGLDEGGRLVVRGPNIMAGYLRHDNPGVLEPPEDGWHDTGDIVDIDNDGFIAIRGRAKRFAKIGGEMISLAAVEAYAANVWPDHSHAATNIADNRKGERIVLITDCPDADCGALRQWARRHGVAELMIPKNVVPVEMIPVLGTGKTDYVEIRRLAEISDNKS
jgi:acyl-[acyl-carrier-protein]-phospholipid O-acyltransferase/long-chain-fatty-acid--[acyl-carrier-protein] ligase